MHCIRALSLSALIASFDNSVGKLVEHESHTMLNRANLPI